MDKRELEQHLEILGWVHITLAILVLLLGTGVFLFFTGIGAASGDPQAAGILGILGLFAGGLLFILGFPGLAAGYGLLKRRPWARVVTIVVSVLQLFNIPIGTLLGAWGLWILTQPNAPEYFDPTPATAATP